MHAERASSSVPLPLTRRLVCQERGGRSICNPESISLPLCERPLSIATLPCAERSPLNADGRHLKASQCPSPPETFLSIMSFRPCLKLRAFCAHRSPISPPPGMLREVYPTGKKGAQRSPEAPLATPLSIALPSWHPAPRPTLPLPPLYFLPIIRFHLAC